MALLILISICLVLFGIAVGLLVAACINNNNQRKIMETQAQAVEALNAAKAQIESQNAKLTAINDGVLKIGRETDGLKTSIATLLEQLANGGTVSAELQAAITGVQESLAATEAAIATVQTSVAEGDAKVDDEVPPTP